MMDSELVERTSSLTIAAPQIYTPLQPSRNQIRVLKLLARTDWLLFNALSSLLRMLTRTCKWLATDPRDKCSALAGLADGETQ
jgi:hypothetical protein